LIKEDDLFISVSNPKKHVDSMETYISYKVTTKTTRSSFDNSEYETYRRYQDFVWLRNQLEQEHPTNLVPPLPSKFIMKSVMDRFSLEFIKTRCQALHNFMKRISHHKILSNNENLKLFLTVDASELAGIKKKTGEGFISRFSGSVKSIAGSGGVKLKDPDRKLVEKAENVNYFGEKMNVLIRIVERVTEEKKCLADELFDFAPTFSDWANHEEALSPVLNSLSSCISSCSKSLTNNLTDQESHLLPPLREYLLYTDVIKSLMRKRDITQADFERLVDEENRKKEEKMNLPRSDQSYSLGAVMGRNASEVRIQKEKKIEEQLVEITNKRKESFEIMELSNKDLNSELEQWSIDKIVDITSAIDTAAASQIRYHQECIEAWESVLPEIQESNTSEFLESGEVEINES